MPITAHPDDSPGTTTLTGRRSGGGSSRQDRGQGHVLEIDAEGLLLECRAPSRRNPARFVCGAKLGETLEEVRFMGVVRRWADRERATRQPRDVRRCPKCGWYNLYEPSNGSKG